MGPVETSPCSNGSDETAAAFVHDKDPGTLDSRGIRLVFRISENVSPLLFPLPSST